MTFQLPNESSSQFKDFFTELDKNLEKLGIRSYGVGITTLEEVFLRIAKGDETEEESDLVQEKDGQPAKNQFDDYSIVEQHETGAVNVFFQNLSALLKKKFLL
jgi:ATP-binding cassette subfamily A (ABC1) protein 3